MSPEKKEIFKSLESWVSQNVLPRAKPAEECLQPRHLLPDSSLSSDEFIDQVKALRE
jgi:acyl-[acyl-carrier-protein] desaturase